MKENKPNKPGIGTTEFWMVLAITVFSSLITSGVIDPEHKIVQVVSAIVAGLTAVGYVGFRSWVKVKSSGVTITTLPGMTPKPKDNGADGQ